MREREREMCVSEPVSQSYTHACVWECVSVCVWERERERMWVIHMCVSVSVSNRGCECVCVWERERERCVSHTDVCIHFWEKVCVYERERERGNVYIYESECVGERECVSHICMWLSVSNRDCVWESVCVWERERERMSVCIFIHVWKRERDGMGVSYKPCGRGLQALSRRKRERERDCVCVRECVCVWESERECVYESVWESQTGHTHSHLYALYDEGHCVVVLPLIYWALQIGRPLGTKNLALAEVHPAAALEIYQ